LWAAAAREVFEETGLKPLRWWALEHLTLYYEPASDALVVLPVFAAELPGDARVRLSDEHDAHAFASPAAAGRRVLWDAQRAAIAAVRRELFGHPALSPRARASHPRDITALVTGGARTKSASPTPTRRIR
jgi:dATP pyrophosphohydrolase